MGGLLGLGVWLRSTFDGFFCGYGYVAFRQRRQNCGMFIVWMGWNLWRT